MFPPQGKQKLQATQVTVAGNITQSWDTPAAPHKHSRQEQQVMASSELLARWEDSWFTYVHVTHSMNFSCNLYSFLSVPVPESTVFLEIINSSQLHRPKIKIKKLSEGRRKGKKMKQVQNTFDAPNHTRILTKIINTNTRKSQWEVSSI